MSAGRFSPTDPVAAAERVYAQAKARLERARGLKAKSARKRDAHQKILVGAIILSRARQSASAAGELARILRAQKLSPRDVAALAPLLEELDTV